MRRFLVGFSVLLAVALLLCLASCEEAGTSDTTTDPDNGDDAELDPEPEQTVLELLDGYWSTGGKTLTLSEIGQPFLTVCNVSYDSETNTFESAISFYNDEVVPARWVLYSGTRGAVEHDEDTGMLSFVGEEEYHLQPSDWSTTETGSYPYTVVITDNSIEMTSDSDGDGECCAVCAFDDGETVDWSTDIFMALARQPETLTLTGTVSFSPPPTEGGTAQVGVAKTDVFDPSITSTVPFEAETASFEYSIAVPPGNYLVGGVVDYGDDGAISDGDYYGWYNWDYIPPDTGEICLPVYEGNTSADFEVELFFPIH